jgi:hypothetical protein
LNSASDASELTQCKRKRKCRNEDKYDGSLEVHNSSRFARSLPKSVKKARYSKDCRNTTWRQALSVHLRDDSSEPMDKWHITSRVEELRREILQIQEANRNYKRNTTHNVLEIETCRSAAKITRDHGGTDCSGGPFGWVTLHIQ